MIFFSRNISEPLEGEVQTIQRAELAAILRALELVPKDQDVEIVASYNAINCSLVWYKNWETNSWQTSVGKPVQHRDLVVAIRELIERKTERM